MVTLLPPFFLSSVRSHSDPCGRVAQGRQEARHWLHMRKQVSFGVAAAQHVECGTGNLPARP